MNVGIIVLLCVLFVHGYMLRAVYVHASVCMSAISVVGVYF